MLRYVNVIAASVLLGFLPSSGSCCKAAETMTRDEVRTLIAKEISVGASSDQVEKFFKRHKISYSYDEFSNRYQSRIDVTKYHCIFTLIFLDNGKRFARADVQDIYTGP